MPAKDDKPVTRRELREELKRHTTKRDLDAAIAKCATKKDLDAAIAKCATKKDLDAAIAKCATKKDLDAAIAKCATKEDLRRTRTELEASIAKCATQADILRIVLKLGEILDQLQVLKEQSVTRDEFRVLLSAVDKISKDNQLLWNKDLVQDERLRVLEERCPPAPAAAAAP